MKRIIVLALGIMLLMESQAFAIREVLTDNTLISGEILSCIVEDSIKELTITGTATDTAAVYCNGALIDTITLVATSEVWFWSFSCSTFKVDTTAVAGTPVATLTCK